MGKQSNIYHLLQNYGPCKYCDLNVLCQTKSPDSQQTSIPNSITECSKPLKNGQHIFRQGDTFTNLHIVRTGSVKIYFTKSDGTEQVLGFCYPGDLLSIDCIQGEKHHCSAVTLDTSSICRLPFNRIEELSEQQSTVYKHLLKIAAREITEKHDLLLLLGQKPAEEKFAYFLLLMSKKNSRCGYSKKELTLKMRRHDIANYLCLADETISRLFSKFAEAGIIEVRNKLVKINDMEKLKTIAKVWEENFIDAMP